MKLIRETTVCRYPGQNKPQPKRLTIDADGNVVLDYAPETNCYPSDVWHRVTPSIGFDGLTKTSDIVEFYRKNKASFETVARGREVVWNGSNRVGKYTAEAEKALEFLEAESSQLNW
jgi:hypothetical protein